MGEANFNKRQCVRALAKLGFSLGNKRRGRHDKYLPPQAILAGLTEQTQPRFIMVPRHNNLHCQNEIISELKAMGGEDLVKQFKALL